MEYHFCFILYIQSPIILVCGHLNSFFLNSSQKNPHFLTDLTLHIQIVFGFIFPGLIFVVIFYFCEHHKWNSITDVEIFQTGFSKLGQIDKKYPHGFILHAM